MPSEASNSGQSFLCCAWASARAAGSLAISATLVSLSAIACDAPKRVEVYGESHFSEAFERGRAREAAIREGVVDALQRAAGAEIARGSQTATTSSLTSLERETREHLVIRSGGRVLGWELLDEEERNVEGMDGTTIVVRLNVDVCPSLDEPKPLVVAIGAPAGLSPDLSGIIRARLAERLEASENLAVVRDAPIDTYHDLRIEIDHAVEVRNIDHSENVAILGRFRNPEMIDEAALRFQLVSVTTTLSAVRFVDRRTVSETVERRRRIAPEVAPDHAIADLLGEGVSLASALLIEKLDSGALDYAQR